MSITIELEPEAESKLRQLAARAGEKPETWIKRLVLAQLTPEIFSNDAANDLASVYGKWPDPPNDAELKEELAYLARQKTKPLSSLK